MRKLTRKILAIGAGITLLGGIGAGALATAGAANAVTPSCGIRCIDLYSENFTNGQVLHPSFVMDVYKRNAAVGAPVILFRSSNNDPAEDFTVSDEGTVADFYSAGLVSSAVALHYGCTTPPFATCTAPVQINDYAFESEYAPYGADTGLCVGVASTAVASEKVSLQPCGVSSKTVWILDLTDSPGSLHNFEAPLINGSDTNFSHPFVLTYPGGGYPTDQPRPQLYVANITGESSGAGPVIGTVDDNQLWSAVFGPLP